VALARSLNRTLVLPRLWCYCDKFWSRLSGCAIPEAASSQPLPFVCPMDHVVELQYWHGEIASRSRRPRAGMLASRADGPWQDGMCAPPSGTSTPPAPPPPPPPPPLPLPLPLLPPLPFATGLTPRTAYHGYTRHRPYRSHYWLRQLGAHPAIGMSSATLVRASVHKLDARRIKVLTPNLPTPTPTPTPTLASTSHSKRALAMHTAAHPTARTLSLQVPRQLLDLAAEQLPLQRHGLRHEVVAGEPGPRLLLPEGGLSDVELRDALQPYEHVALLRVAMFEAGQVRDVACAWRGHGVCMVYAWCMCGVCTACARRVRGVCMCMAYTRGRQGRRHLEQYMPCTRHARARYCAASRSLTRRRRCAASHGSSLSTTGATGRKR
jgi:hypothetical protein